MSSTLALGKHQGTGPCYYSLNKQSHPGNRPCRSPASHHDYAHALGGGRGKVGLGPSPIPFSPQLQPTPGPKGDFRHKKKGARGHEIERSFIRPSFIRKCVMGRKDLSAAPGSIGLPGSGRQLISFPPKSSAEALARQTNQKGREGTQRHISTL